MGELGTILTYSNVGDLVVVILCWVDLLYSCPPTRVQDAVVQYSLAAGIQDLPINDFVSFSQMFIGSPLFCETSLEVHYHTCSTTGKPTHLFRTKCVSLDSV